MTIVQIGTYSSLPCSCEFFTINGLDAIIDDFGSVEDLRPDIAEPYGCGDRQFVPKMPTDEVLKKYSINLKDYSDICDILSEKLAVGGCGWCI